MQTHNLLDIKPNSKHADWCTGVSESDRPDAFREHRPQRHVLQNQFIWTAREHAIYHESVCLQTLRVECWKTLWQTQSNRDRSAYDSCLAYNLQRPLYEAQKVTQSAWQRLGSWFFCDGKTWKALAENLFKHLFDWQRSPNIRPVQTNKATQQKGDEDESAAIACLRQNFSSAANH